MKELLVKTGNPEALGRAIESLGGFVEQNPDGSYPKKTVYSVRTISGNIEFLKFAIKNQGYAEIVGEREIK